MSTLILRDPYEQRLEAAAERKREYDAQLRATGTSLNFKGGPLSPAQRSLAQENIRRLQAFKAAREISEHEATTSLLDIAKVA